MKLERLMSQFSESDKQQVYFEVSDLEYLSSSSLYSPSGPLIGSGPLTIRPFSGFQLHIHEIPGGIAHIKYPDGTYTEINSYDAAMADLLADKLNMKKIIKEYIIDNHLK